MASKFIDIKISMIWFLSYQRAISTAKYIADLNSIGINISSIFNERKLGNSIVLVGGLSCSVTLVITSADIQKNNLHELNVH